MKHYFKKGANNPNVWISVSDKPQTTK